MALSGSIGLYTQCMWEILSNDQMFLNDLSGSKSSHTKDDANRENSRINVQKR